MASQVSFTEIANPPSRFLLDDGTEIFVKPVVTRIIKTGELLPDGQPRFELKLQLIIDQMAPAGEIDIKQLTNGGS